MGLYHTGGMEPLKSFREGYYARFIKITLASMQIDREYKGGDMFGDIDDIVDFMAISPTIIPPSPYFYNSDEVW